MTMKTGWAAFGIIAVGILATGYLSDEYHKSKVIVAPPSKDDLENESIKVFEQPQAGTYGDEGTCRMRIGYRDGKMMYEAWYVRDRPRKWFIQGGEFLLLDANALFVTSITLPREWRMTGSTEGDPMYTITGSVAMSKSEYDRIDNRTVKAGMVCDIKWINY